MRHFSIVAGCFLLLCQYGHTQDVAKVRLTGEPGQTGSNKTEFLPSALAVDVILEGENVHLTMDRNLDQDVNIPFYVLHTDAEGKPRIQRVNTDMNVTLYQDTRQGAAFGIVHKRNKNGTVSKSMECLIKKGAKWFDLKSQQSAQDAEDLTPPEGPRSVQDILMDVHVQDDRSLGFPDMVDYVVLPATAQESFSARRRQKRQVTQDVYVDFVALVDYGVYTAWYDRSTENSASDKKRDTLDAIYQYYAFVSNGMNMMYGSITSLSYTIHIRLTAIIVSETASASPWTETIRKSSSGGKPDTVDAQIALVSLMQWAAANPAILPPYDHLMLFCGYDLMTNTSLNAVAGRAWLNRLCQKNGKASSIIEDLGGFQCVKTATHELGHNMGAKHDGAGNNCDYQDGYIMSPGNHNYTESNKLNGWRFSTCSVNYFNTFFTETLKTPEGSRCLYQTETIRSEVPSVASLMPGQIYGADEQCRQIFGSSSHVCRSLLVNVSNICPKMSCRNPTYTSKEICTRIVAARGTTCGNKRWCIAGQCVYDRSAPLVPDNCPVGDSPRKIKNGENCTVFVNFHPGLCYTSVFKLLCCSACAARYRTVRNCEYGNKVLNCDAALNCSSESSRQSCCRTCNYGEPFTTTTTPFPTPSTTTSTVASRVPPTFPGGKGNDNNFGQNDNINSHKTTVIAILVCVGVIVVAAAAGMCVAMFRQLHHV